MIADTDVLIDLMQAEEPAVEAVGTLEKRNVSIRISAMSLFELFHGLERVENPSKRRRRIQSVIDTKEVYPAGERVMKKAGRLDGQLADSGETIGIGDTIIAATGLVHEEPILTRNVRHFRRIDGLDCETY